MPKRLLEKEKSESSHEDMTSFDLGNPWVDMARVHWVLRRNQLQRNQLQSNQISYEAVFVK